MITDNVLEFLGRQIFMHVGTRDAKLRPREIMAWGIMPNEDKKTITLLIPEKTVDKTLSNLQDNGKISLTCVYVQTHESYQFKGSYLQHRKASDAEHTRLLTYVEGYKPVFQVIGLPVDFIQEVAVKPSVAVDFKVEEIYVQTPGPQAGKKIN